MLNFLDVYERAISGPLMSEDDFMMKVFVPVLTDIVDSHGIVYDRNRPVPDDDRAADTLYDAGVEFLERVGFYCVNTSRVIQFTRKEILEAIREAPGQCVLGEGKDVSVYTVRTPDDARLPLFNVGHGWVCTSEEMATNQIEALASLSGARAMKFPNLDHIRGIPIAIGSPMEIYASIRMIRIAREAMRRAGRPGMPIMSLLTTAADAATTLAASHPQFGLRPTDEWICGSIAEMKVDFGVLNKVACLQNWGANVGFESAPILGGYCGGPAGTAVVNTAYIIFGVLAFQANDQLTFPTHFRYGCTTTRDVLWVVSSSCQAASRHVPVPVNWACYAAAGPNTKMYFYESAAFFLCSGPSGTAGMGTPHPAKGVKVDRATPMEAKFGIEMGTAACKLTRSQANDIVLKVLEKYESRIPEPPDGDRYQDCYEVRSGKPGEAYLRLYDEMKEELVGMGIPLE